MTLSILGEAVVVGVVASALGFGLGILLAGGLKALLDAIGFDIPASHIVIPTSAVVASFLVGTTVTVVSALGAHRGRRRVFRRSPRSATWRSNAARDSARGRRSASPSPSAAAP